MSLPSPRRLSPACPLLALAVLVFTLALAPAAHATHVGDDGVDAAVAAAVTELTPEPPPVVKVLIHGETVSGGINSREAQAATAAGYVPTVVSGATWSGMTQADFASYDALVIGDPACGYLPASAFANRATWVPVVMGKAVRKAAGNRIVIGTDPVYHHVYQGMPGALALIRAGVKYAGSLAGRTGLYFSTSCDQANNDAINATLTNLSEGTGTWSQSDSPPCGGNVAVIAQNDAFSTVTRSGLAGWQCSIHKVFPTFPDDWSPLAVATDTSEKPVCGTDVTVNPPLNACGQAYILLAGGGTVLVAPNLSLTPTTSTSEEDGTHAVTATLTDANAAGAPLVGQLVNFTVTGANTGASGTCAPADCKTNAEGKVTFTYTGANAGEDTITSSFTDSNGTKQQANATKTWTAKPVDTSPVVTFAGEATREYGESETPRVFDYTVEDADGGTPTVETSCGDGGEKVDDTDTDGDGTWTLRCLFENGDATSTVTATATDDTDKVGSDTVAVTVKNNPPSKPEVSGLSDFESATAHNWTFKADDPAPSEDAGIDYVIDWGDGSAPQTVTDGGVEEAVEHLYATACACTISVKAVDDDGAESEATTYPLTVRPWVTPDAGPGYAIAEGDSLTLDASGTDGENPGSLVYSWDVNGDGTFGDATGEQPTLTWADLVALGVDDGPYDDELAVQVTDGEWSQTDDAGLDVANTAPTLTAMNGPAPELVAKTPYDWTFSGSDPSPVDQAALQFAADWEDDLNTTAASPLSHAWALPGEYLVTAKAVDKDGGESATDSREVFIGGTVDGFVEGFGRTFMVGGTTGGDSFNVKRVGTSVVITVLGSAPKTYTIPSTIEVLLYGGPGDDTFLVESTVLQQVTAVGGPGNDAIDVRSPNAVGVGGAGDDKVVGNDFGRDMLFGGDGLDTLDGKGGEDLLVAGRVPWERANLKARTALESLQLEWLRSTVAFRTRVAHLDGTSTGALNKVFLRVSDPGRTVFDDIAADSLTGGASNDWVLANRVLPGTLDTLVGAAEALTELTP